MSSKYLNQFKLKISSDCSTQGRNLPNLGSLELFNQIKKSSSLKNIHRLPSTNQESILSVLFVNERKKE